MRRFARRVGNLLPTRLQIITGDASDVVVPRGQHSCPPYAYAYAYTGTGIGATDTHGHANALVSPAP